MKIKRLILTALLLAVASSIGFAQTKTGAVAPDAVVRNLYAAQKNPKTSPFFQAKKRALVDKYFTKALADLLWKDVAGADGVGNLDFDPLYNAQDKRAGHQNHRLQGRQTRLRRRQHGGRRRRRDVQKYGQSRNGFIPARTNRQNLENRRRLLPAKRRIQQFAQSHFVSIKVAGENNL